MVRLIETRSEFGIQLPGTGEWRYKGQTMTAQGRLAGGGGCCRSNGKERGPAQQTIDMLGS
jgi:hypothetical protein